MLKPRYHHFESIEGRFYNNLTRYKILSVNGFAVDIDSIPGDFRISRFIRDPRDLIISGYFYHYRGAEPWFRFKKPTLKYWEPINGNIPNSLPPNCSYSDYLQSMSKEDGLIAEIEFRKFQLESLRAWKPDPRIMIFRYEDILGNEAKIFDSLLSFYQVSAFERKMGSWLANRYAATSQTKSKHIRNAKPGQWKDHFTPKVETYFNDRYQDILADLGY